MELIITINNFEDGGVCRDINSPRSLEACLRSGLDPLGILYLLYLYLNFLLITIRVKIKTEKSICK